MDCAKWAYWVHNDPFMSWNWKGQMTQKEGKENSIASEERGVG